MRALNNPEMKLTVARRDTTSRRLAEIFLAGLAFRVAVTLYLSSLSSFHYGWGASETAAIARSLVEHHAYGSAYHGTAAPTAWLTPGYPLILAGIFAIFGVETKAAAIVATLLNSVFSAATALIVYRIGKLQFDEATGFAGAWIWALCPYLTILPYLVWDTCLSALVLSCCILLTIRAESFGSRFIWMSAGVAWGLEALISPAMLAPLPVILIYLWYRSRSLSRIALLAGTAVLVISPWCIRNQIVFHEGLLLRSNGWAEVYFGNIDYEAHPSGPTGEYQRVGEIAYVRSLRARTLEYIRQNPGKFLADSARRARAFWVVPYNFAPLPAWIAVLSFLGLWWTFKDYGIGAIPLALILIFCPLIYYFCYSFSRYRHPIEPAMFTLAAYACVRMWRRVSID